MKLNSLGKSGLRVSATGLGLAALGRPGYINLGHAEDLQGDHRVAAMEARAHRMLDAAFERGVRYFDAARSYGRAEAFLASWLAQRKLNDEVTVGSKWGYTYTADWQVDAEKHEVKEHSLEKLSTQYAESRALLGNGLDLYQIHSATLETGVLENTAVLGRLASLKAEGLAVGLSLSGEGQVRTLEHALKVEVDGVPLFDAVQATFNVLEPSVGETLAQAHKAGLGVIVKEALANGRLTERNDAPDFADTLALLSAQASRLETTVDALALAFVLAQPWADTVLSGASTVDQLESNLKATELNLDEEALEALAGLAEPPERYWSTRAALHWN